MMRFISMVKFTEADAMPPPKAFVEAMDQLMKDVAKEGCTMVEGVGLLRRRLARASGLPEAR
jgi:hypothetical protein